MRNQQREEDVVSSFLTTSDKEAAEGKASEMTRQQTGKNAKHPLKWPCHFVEKRTHQAREKEICLVPKQEKLAIET
jgi:hypothetical protein